MAQYFEVLSPNDNLEQTRQFFNGNQDNEQPQVRYILADDTPQFPAQQLILSGDQVMVLEGSQQQIVIDQGRAYQAANQQQQFGAVVHNTTGMGSQPTQHIFYMESGNVQGNDNISGVQAVIEQTAIQSPQQPPQPQPIVLNHQLAGQRSVSVARQGNTQVNPPRTVLAPGRPGLPQQARLQQPGMRSLPSHQPQQMRIRNTMPQIRSPLPQQLQQQQNQLRAANTLSQLQHAKNLALYNRQVKALQQQKQQQLQQQAQQQAPAAVQQQQQQVLHEQTQHQATSGQVAAGQIQKDLAEFQQLRQQQINNTQEQETKPVREQVISIGKQIVKPFSEFRSFSSLDGDVEELDDHDPAMNSTPGQMVMYKKLLEQRQIGKNPILARLSSNIKITATPTNQQQQQQAQNPPCSIAHTIDQVVNQQAIPERHQVNQERQQPVAQQLQVPASTPTQQHIVPIAQVPQRKPRAPPSTSTVTDRGKGPRNPNGAGRAPARQRVQKVPVVQQPFSGAQQQQLQQQQQQQTSTPRFPLNNQQQPRFPNQQQQMMQQRAAQFQQQQQQHQQQQQQQQNAQAPPTAVASIPLPPQQQRSVVVQQNPAAMQQQNGMTSAAQSQINYLITPPTPNKPRQQRPLPAYIPSSQIQQIIENTPSAEEFSDSIRMLVLLENGEQRLITFTLPKEACTIQEILEQVNVPFTPETNIQVTEANTNGINYIVTVGNVTNFATVVNEEEQQQHQQQQQQQQLQQQQEQENVELEPQLQQQQQHQPPFAPKPEAPVSQGVPIISLAEAAKPPTPEPPKLIPGKLAVCTYCGYTGEDFNKCRRCTRRLPENVKAMDAPSKIDLFKKSSSNGSSVNANLFNTSMLAKSSNIGASAIAEASSPLKSEPASSSSKSPSPVKKRTSKSKVIENEAVVISSDEEDDEKKPVRSVSEQLLNKLGASISISPVTKEPSLNEIKKHVRKLSMEPTKCFKLSLRCRTVRIGSYRVVPSDDVILDSKCVIIKAPVADNNSEIKTVRIDRGDIVKVLVCFNKALPVVFFYLNVGAAPIIRDMLNLKRENGLYFDPVDEKEDSYRKITLLPEDILDEHRSIINQLYGVAPYVIIDELTPKEANDILIKACPKDSSTSGIGPFSEIKQILMYPKEGQGRLSINTEDYVCLAVDQFLNDKIIDFYLKYLWENLPPLQQEKVHIFSTFFYKRLTTKPTKAAKKSHPYESDSTLTAAEKRHSRVKNWTKRINLFEKEFIIVPINENAHWFLAIICFPGLTGPQTFDGKPYNPEPKPKRTKKKQTAEMKKEKPIPCDDPLLSDKDEAESEDSDLESDDSEETVAAAERALAAAAEAAAAAAAATIRPATSPSKGRGAARVPIKQPTILIFDSLAGPSRCRVVATLRDYLTVEYKTKMDSERIFSRDIIKGTSCKVPQQTNFTDCGLYLLQYVEQFFKDPIRDFNVPIKQVQDWFEEIVVTRKREEICNLLKELMIESGVDVKILPDIALPTLNGKLIERPEAEHDHETGEEEQEDMFTDIEDSEMTDVNSSLNTTRVSEENGTSQGDQEDNNDSSGENSSQGTYTSSPIKPSESSVGDKSEIQTTAVESAVLKPSLSEFPNPRQSNKDTLNYLKSKRIVRHKTGSDGPELKKTKLDSC